jgi:hypothetical protein
MSLPSDPPLQGTHKRKRSKYMTNRKVQSLLMKAEATLKGATKDLQEVRELIEPIGLSAESSIFDPMFRGDVVVLKTTGGHSNTDHVVQVTGDVKMDRIRELKRALQRRSRLMQPEARGEDRWDKPKIPGERRRRIQRDKDLPGAPPEPPPSGYLIFIGQMTCKHRHDHPAEQHNQTRVVQEISKVWKFGMTPAEREYYNVFARDLRDEYMGQHHEYRATGNYRPSDRFGKLQGIGPWVKREWAAKNGLEVELEEYDTVKFPERPPELQEEYEQRRKGQHTRRMLREKRAIEVTMGSPFSPNEDANIGDECTSDVEFDLLDDPMIAQERTAFEQAREETWTTGDGSILTEQLKTSVNVASVITTTDYYEI